MIRIGYLGPQGTFSECAAEKYAAGQEAELIPFSSLKEIGLAVRDGYLDEGIMPVENSNEGAVNLTLDLLAHELNELMIRGEIILAIKHHLLAHSGTKKEEISRILSHPQPLAQCRDFIAKEFSGVSVSEAASTAEAAKFVSRGDRTWAAIGTGRAAALNNLVVLIPDLDVPGENTTRFIVLGRSDCAPGPRNKTSLIVSVTDRPGALYLLLKEFAVCGINLTRIESRPAKTKLGDYLFFIDLAGHREEPNIAVALASVKAQAAFFRILGSYPACVESLTKAAKTVPSIADLRADIDIIDGQIVELLARRTNLVKQIGALKTSNRIRDPRREQELTARLKALAEEKGFDSTVLENIYRLLFDHYVALQTNKNPHQHP